MGLFKKETEEEKAINELNGKKNMLVNALQKDINSIDEQIEAEYRQIGAMIFEEYSENGTVSFDMSKYEESLEKLNKCKSDITEKENKVEEICERYDDEINILKESIGIKESLCPSCQLPYNSGVDSFCMNCGQKL